MLRPRIILGESKDIFLKYLDTYLVESNKKSKRALIFSASLVLTHGLITKVIFKDYFKKPRLSKAE